MLSPSIERFCSIGVIVIGCSHAGIVSIVHKAMKITGSNRAGGIVGGFHLIDASTEIIDRTPNELKNLNINKQIYSVHCKWFEAEYRFRKIFRGDFTILSSGMVIDV